jgi:hypothetical protein
MIKKWHKFNESQSNKLTKEMAQEIIYYISEDSRPSKEIAVDIYNTIDDNDDFVMYETGYEEMKEMIRKLLSICQNNVELTEKMIQIYHKIRKEREIFPHAHEIEEMLLDFMDSEDFDFMIYSSKYKYRIKLSKWKQANLSQFIKNCQDINKSLIRLESPDYKTKLSKCEYANFYQTSSYFEIELYTREDED